MTHHELEEGTVLALDWDKLDKIAATHSHVVPVAVQNAETGELLVIAYANQEALDYTRAHGIAAFWSTSRNELWVKGKTSGDTLKIVDIRVNCEQNSLLYRVIPQGQGSCHTKDASGKSRSGCYYRRLNADGTLSFL